MKHSLLLLTSLLCFTSSPAQADTTHWLVNKDKTTLTFSGAQGGKEFKGHFTAFTPDIAFNADKLAASHIKVVIETGSATTGDKVYDGSLPGPEWFNIRKFPQATFESSAIRAIGGVDKAGITNYEASGKLTILGMSKDVTLPFSLKTEGTDTHAFGEIILKRLDYGIGEKADSKAEWVSNDVKVRFDVFAHP